MEVRPLLCDVFCHSCIFVLINVCNDWNICSIVLIIYEINDSVSNRYIHNDNVDGGDDNVDDYDGNDDNNVDDCDGSGD